MTGDARGVRPIVAVLGGLYDDAAEEVLAESTHLRFVAAASARPDAASLAGVHGIVPRYPERVDGELIAAIPTLLSIVASGRGVDNIDVSAASAAGVAVANNPGIGSRAVAEHAIGLMLALARGVGACARDGLDHAWQRRLDVRRVELGGKTLGIVGCGNVGGAVARIATRGFGMRVLAYDPYKPEQEIRAVGAVEVDALATVLAQSDFVSLHPELTPETRGMIDAAALAKMRRDAFLVNTSRGAVVHTNALLDALRMGRIAGAGLDVFDPEPPAEELRRSAPPNLLLTPHVADMTVESRRELALAAARQMLDVLAGRRPSHLLNPDVWEHVLSRRERLLVRG